MQKSFIKLFLNIIVLFFMSLNLPGVLISSLQRYLAAYSKSQTMGDSCQKKKREREKHALNKYYRILNKKKLYTLLQSGCELRRVGGLAPLKKARSSLKDIKTRCWEEGSKKVVYPLYEALPVNMKCIYCMDKENNVFINAYTQFS